MAREKSHLMMGMEKEKRGEHESGAGDAPPNSSPAEG